MVYKAVRFIRNCPAMPPKPAPLLRIRAFVQRRSPDLSLAAALVLAAAKPGAGAKPRPGPPCEAAPQAVPGFWDPRRRPDRPDLSRLTVIRFLTETDYPPFNFTGADGNPAGFNVDLARALCEEIKVTCTVQMRRFETLLDAHLEQPRRCHHRLAGGDAAVARPSRFHRSLLPRAGALRVAARRRDAGDPARISRGQESRRHRRLLA